MFVITVVPLRRGVTISALSYFSSIAYTPGSLVTIPIRTTTALGLVTEIQEVSTAKTAIRAATFSLRKLPEQKNVQVLSEAFRATANALSAQYIAPLGTILHNLLPTEIRNGDVTIPHTHHLPLEKEMKTPHILQAKKSDRHLAYRSLVRETFAHSGSMLIVVPSSIEAEELLVILAPGIPDRVTLMSNACTPSEIKKAFAQLEDFSKTRLIIATPTYALIERHDITTVIIEHAQSPHYKEFNRPYLDYRDVLTIHARYTGRTLLIADILPRTEDEVLRRTDVYATYGETPKRLALEGTISIIDTNPKETTSIRNFSLFSNEVRHAIEKTHLERGRVFLFSARRGLAPLVTCIDCGFIFRSKESGAPYSLIRTTHNGIEERWFVCSTSGEKIRATDTCTACGSWRLQERGIGIQHVFDELHKHFPHIPVTLFDHITAKTYKKSLFLKESFYATKGGILLGTHMAIPYLTDMVDTSVIINMDALLATPTWRLEEDNLSLLLRLREITKDTVYIQTRSPEAPILSYATQGCVETFYTDELALRKAFSYPPFVTFVHLTWQGNVEVVTKIETDVREILREYELAVYQNPLSSKDSLIMYGLIRVPKEAWPDSTLVQVLRTLPPSVRTVINPDRIV